MCDCGATDCPSCGPLQGYTVQRVYRPGRGWRWVNPEPDDDAEDAPEVFDDDI
jgi:hypothetical protein